MSPGSDLLTRPVRGDPGRPVRDAAPAMIPKTTPAGEAWPRITVVTPSFNQAPFLEETLRSVLDQGYPELEYIVIDGGSTDGSREILERYGDRLSSWVSEPDPGHGAALQKGFDRSTGEILAWINSDDKLLPWSLWIVGEIFAQHKDVHWIMGRHTWWDALGRQVKVQSWPRNIYDFLRVESYSIQQESTFWRRSLHERAGGRIRADGQLMVDAELWSRFFPLEELWQVDTTLGGFRVHAGNRSRVDGQRVLAELREIKQQLLSRCSSRVRANLKLLQRIDRLHRWLPYLDVRAIARDLMRRRFRAEVDHKTLVFVDGAWKKVTRPYAW